MRILTRYILREVTSHAVIGAAIFTFVLFTRDLGRILELVVRASAPLPSVAEIFLYTVPLALTYTIPMSVLVGILIGLSRLAADSEITAMRASGMGVWSFGRVLAIFVAAAWMLALSNSLYVAPWSLASLGHLEEQLKGSQVSFEVRPRVFYEGFPKLVLYVQDVHSAQGGAIWNGVFLADISDASNPRITLAREGILVPEGQDRLHLHLVNGSSHETDPAQADHYQISTFEQTDIPIELPSTENKADEQVPYKAMGTWALHDRAASVDPATARLYLIEFHNRFALPTACLVLAMVGIPLRTLLEEEREVRRICAHDRAGLRLLLCLSDRSFAGQAGQGQSRDWGLAGQLRILRRGLVPSVASRAAALRAVSDPDGGEGQRTSGKWHGTRPQALAQRAQCLRARLHATAGVQCQLSDAAR